MKTRIISTLALLAGLILSGCSREEMPDGGVAGEGNRVVFTLAGITPQNQTKVTRAMGDNESASTDALAATTEEKSVSSLLAVAYEKQSSGEMGLYNVFDVNVTPDGCSFDIAKEGRFDLYLVANANTELTSAIKSLSVTSPVSELEELIVSQAPGTPSPFLMTTPAAVKVISYSGEVADCGEVSLRRLAVRIDLVNKADELTVNNVTFRNRAIKSQLFAPNQMITESGAVQDTTYESLNLVGNLSQPAEYKAHIYSYENLSAQGDATIPTLEIEYTYQGQPYTHQVQFLDAKDPSGMTPLALKRNYLYRITIGRKLEPEFNVEVMDWTNEESLSVDAIPFQGQMNAALAVNRFASANVATLDEAQHAVTFTTTSPNTTSYYTAWNAQWAQSVYYNAADKTYYRVPTKDEMYLLFPDNANLIRFDQAMDGTSEVTETLPDNLFGNTEVNGGEGTSVFKNGTASTVSTLATGVDYPVVYAIRFKGTAQYAAYRYEIKNWDNTETGELEIRIKALQEGSLWTIDEVANEAYWGDPSDGNTDVDNQLIYHIPAAGWKESSENPLQGQGSGSYLWTQIAAEGSNAYEGGHNTQSSGVNSYAQAYVGTLRLVKATDAEIMPALNKALKVNMFTAFNAQSVDLSQKKITSFFDQVVSTSCPRDSYFTYAQLKDAGVTENGVLFDGPDGKKYRLPTVGEFALLEPLTTEEPDRASVHREHDGMYHPYWNENSSTNTFPYVTMTVPFTETIYLQNGADNKPDKTHPDDPAYTLKGESQLWIGRQTEQVTYPALSSYIYNVDVVYALRFKGTNQYAAYRWESCQVASEPLERYLSIKIKALKQGDERTTIETVADDSFWQDRFIEFKMPASGYYLDESIDLGVHTIRHEGVDGYAWSSSLSDYVESEALRLGFSLYTLSVARLPEDTYFLPLRFVSAQE